LRPVAYPSSRQRDPAAERLGVRPERIDVRTAANLDAAFAAALRQRAEAVFVHRSDMAASREAGRARQAT